jgi:hypothetical protein
MRLRFVLLTVLAALVLAAPASADLASAANAICKPTNRKLGKVQDSGKSTAFVIRRVIAIQTHQQRKLADLRPQSALYTTFLDNGRKLIAVYHSFARINRHPDQAAAQRATRKSMRINRRLEREAHKLGANACYAGSA